MRCRAGLRCNHLPRRTPQDQWLQWVADHQMRLVSQAEDLGASLQVAFDSGGRRILIPMSSVGGIAR